MEHTEHYHAIPQEAPEESSGIGRFFTGFFTSAGKSALMMSIMGVLQFALHVIAPATFSSALAGIGSLSAALTAVAMPLVIIAAVGIFGGIMAVYHGDQHAPAQAHEDVVRNTTIGITAPAIAPQLTPLITADSAPEMAEQAPQRNWTDRPDIAKRSGNSIESILARGSAENHAADIAQRQASATSPTFP